MPTKPQSLLLPQAMVNPGDLHPHPLNAKLHNDAFLESSIEGLGLVQPITVNKRTMTILGGHGTLDAWKVKHPGEPVQVSYVDVDDETSARILLVLNPNPADPGYDDRGLAELLGWLTETADLDYTGWDTGDMDAVLARLAVPEPEPPTPPGDFDEYDDKIPVHFGCPQCGYEWSGSPHPNASQDGPGV